MMHNFSSPDDDDDEDEPDEDVANLRWAPSSSWPELQMSGHSS
jgi:hypothetical protein